MQSQRVRGTQCVMPGPAATEGQAKKHVSGLNMVDSLDRCPILKKNVCTRS